MATLPDLPTNDAGFVAYYNGLDNGASTVEPTNMLDLTSLGTYQQYDNGVKATYVIGRGNVPDFVLNVRVKTDGWVVVWLDREEQFYGFNQDYTTSLGLKTNLGDFFYKWSLGDSVNGTNYNRAMKDVSQAIFSGVSYSYSANDVSLYHYNYTNGTAASVVYLNEEQSGTFSYPTIIDRKAEVMNGYADNVSTAGVVFDGSYIANFGELFSVDSIQEAATPDAGVSYSVNTKANSLFVLTAVFSQ